MASYSSTSSVSSKSSSSSSGCCTTFECSGTYCSRFSNWILSGANVNNTDDCQIYVSCDTYGTSQQVELYKDVELTGLVAIGQIIGAGSISILARNSSGLNGTVTWGGTLTTYPAYLTLSCDVPSSESSSTFSSSSSTSMSESSDSECCANPTCFGTDCNHFSSWLFAGMSGSNTNGCLLYVVFDSLVALKQQIRIYKDQEYTALVAAGQGVSGPITLAEKNGSGLSGTVTWDGTLVYTTATLDCLVSSSSSSSKSSSSSTSSSLSSSSHSFSSFSTGSSSSSSSESWGNVSTSSSSESLGNVSTSSTSSLVEWNKIKPLILGLSSVNSVTIKNRLAQTIYLVDDTYTIGKVYCYFYGPFGTLTNFTVHLDTCTCDDDGKPQTIINSQTLAGATITDDGWYSFTLNLSGVTPTNRYLSFVIWQENGDENNYVLWGYNYLDTNQNISWTSPDNIVWEEQENVLRALKIVGSFNAYDLVNFRLLTPPAEQKIITQDVVGGTLDGLKLVEGGYGYTTPKVVIDHPDFICSFVVDASGSMGWNDRLNTRKTIIESIIDRFRQYYPSDSNIIFDIIRFGSIQLNTETIIDDLPVPININLDLNRPTRTSYVFTVSSASASKNAIYTIDGNNYTVISNYSADTTLICSGEEAPPTNGTLTKVSGTGDVSIIYTEYSTPSISNAIIAYGFKNFEGGHAYNIGNFAVNSESLDEVELTNWQVFIDGGGSVALSTGQNGPNSTSTLNFVAQDGMVIRKPFGPESLSTTHLTQNEDKGNKTIGLQTPSTFAVSQKVDIVDGDFASTNHTALEIGTTTITLDSGLTYDIKGWNENNGIAQLSNYSYSIVINDGTTANLLVKDTAVTKSITFFLQSFDGLMMEWDIQPFEDWILTSLYWLGDTAIIPISAFDKQGNPFPDGTEIQFYVDTLPSTDTNEVTSTVTTRTATIGNKILYVNATEGFSTNDKIDIVEKNGTDIQSTTVHAVGESDTYGPYLEIDDVFLFNISIGSKVILFIEEEEDYGAINNATLLPSSLSIVDTTPIYTGKNISTSLLKPYDPTPVTPTTTYESLNLDSERIRFGINDVPTIDGYSTLRVLPITEDNLKTVHEKNSEGEDLYTPPQEGIIINQEEQNENDLENIAITTTTTTTLMSKGTDWTIDNPVYLAGGIASTAMVSYATDLTLTTIEGFNIPGLEEFTTNTSTDLLVKLYTIYPVIVLKNQNNTAIAKQYLSPVEISFTPPIHIESEYDIDYSGTVKYISDNGYQGVDGSCPGKHSGYTEKYAPGVYATDGGFKIVYIITNRGNALKSGTLNIKMYSNPIADLDKVVAERDSYLDNAGDITSSGKENYEREDLNSVLPPVTVTESDGTIATTQPLSEIDQWRQDVANNIESQKVENVTEGGTLSNAAKTDVETNVVLSYADKLNDLGYTTRPVVVEAEFSYYTNPKEWTLATQYDSLKETTITIEDGRATLEVPESDVSTLLLIQASVFFGDNNQYESIKSNLIVVANPINVDIISPLQIMVDGNKNYEISTEVTWLEQTIADNVIVNFLPEKTDAVPSVSKTNDGIASGVQIGPHKPVIMNCPSTCDTCFGEYEYIDINISYLGYERTIRRLVEWRSIDYDEDDTEQTGDRFPFYLETTGSNETWSDGNGFVKVFSDLTSDNNEAWIGTDGIEALKGLNQPNGLARRVNWLTSSTAGVIIKSDYERWTDGIISADIIASNSNIGHEQPSTESNCPEPNEPWNIQIGASTNYGVYDVNGDLIGAKIGSGVIDEPYPSLNGASVCWPKIELTLKEPLSIDLSVEAYDNQFVRDGVSSPNIIAEVKWKGQYITDKFTVNEGQKDESIIDYALPDITFLAGICLENNKYNNTGTMKDNRNVWEGCLRVGNHADVKLDSYVATVSLSRTDIYSDTDGSHTHGCTVDVNGDGTTSSTIVLSGTYIDDHVHTISNYIALSSGIPAHTHSLRSVAIVKILPMTNVEPIVTINGTVEYNPTGVSTGRMMFSTLYLEQEIREKQLILTLDVANDLRASDQLNNLYTSESVTTTSKGFDIKAYAEFSSYTIESSPGHYVTLPAQPVPDGSRIIFQINAYRPAITDNDILVTRSDKAREYMFIKITGTIFSEGFSASSTQQVTVLSYLQWLPNVKRLLPEMTNDSIYINEALAQINTLGASQIHDAVKQSAQYIIQYQTDNVSWKTSKKAIILLTDGDENTSNYSIDQAIDNVNFIDGDCEVPVIPINLGNSYGSDVNLLRKYVEETCGKLWYSINSSSANIASLIDDIITDGSLHNNDGIYTNTVDLGSENIAFQFRMVNFTLPTNSRILFRVRYGSDNIIWGSWSEWYDSSLDLDFELNLTSKGRYFQYQIHLYGNEYFESPELYSGIETTYYQHQSFTTFFQPNELDIDTDEYLASIHIAHKADIPSTSTVRYGYTQFDSVNYEDYYSTTRPLIIPDRHTIILTRYNEKFLTEDKQTYTAINGGWNQTAIIEVYKINDAIPNGQLVDSTTYAPNNIIGSIKFNNIQNEDDEFVLCVYFDPSYRILCDVTNYGPDYIVIDHIALLYNVSKRITRDNAGNIIHIPIDKVL